MVQRKVNIYDRSGKLFEEIHFPPADISIADGKACSCVQIQVGQRPRQCTMDCLQQLPAHTIRIYVHDRKPDDPVESS